MGKTRIASSALTQPSNGAVSPNAQRFTDYVLSPEAQQMLEKDGLVRAK